MTTADEDMKHSESTRPSLWVGLLLNGGARALTVAAPLVTLPMVTDSLGRTNYGAYAVITAIASFLPFADLGVGLGVITAVSHADGRHDTHAVRTVVSTGFAMLLSVGSVLLVLALLLASLVDWRSVLGITDSGVTGNLSLAVLFVFLSFAVGLPANAGTKVMMGLQMNRAMAFWQAATVPVVIASVAVAYMASAGLAWFVLATLGSPVAVGLVATWWMFCRKRKDLYPRFSLAGRKEAWVLLALGAAFSVASAAAAIQYSSNAIVISHILGADAVAIYNISSRLADVGLLVFCGLLLPLWPVFGSALAAEDYQGTRTHLRNAILLSVAAGALSAIAYVAAAPALIDVWVGSDYLPSLGLLIALAFSSFVQFVAYPFQLLLAGAGAKIFTVVTATATAVASLPLSVGLTNAIGTAGPAWANGITKILFGVIPSVYYADRYIRRRSELARRDRVLIRSAPATER